MSKLPSLREIVGLSLFSGSVAILLSHFGFGENDWSAYWRATRLFLSGQDPYSLVAHQQLTAQHPETSSPGLQIWNPPFLFPILAPVAVWSFHVSVQVLHFISVFLSCFMAWICFDSVAPRSLRLLPGAFVFLFPPLLLNVKFGQLGVIIAFGVFMGVYFLLRRKDFLSGLFFVLATPKPHSWYLIAALTALIIISERRWRIIAGGLVGLFPLFLCCFLFNPEIFSRWVSLENNPLTWASVSGITPIRVWLSSFGLPNKWPLFVIPVVSTAIVLFIYIYRRSLWTVEESVVAIVALSMLTAPFGWGFDQMLLVCPFIFSIAHGIRERGGELSVSASCALAPMLGLLYLAFLPYFEAYWFFLYAPALYISWWFTKRLRERSLRQS